MEEIKKEIIEKVILVAVADQDTTEAEESLDELEELVKTAGAEVAARVIQVRETPHPGTYIGKGKIDEVNALLYGTDATGIVCDDELSPAQISNLEEALDTKVMDRTLIILDIFAKRAFTREGKIQVELAQLKYRASKLTGQGRALSRLGGGIGTRGPGEKKLEMDRRLIRTRISRLKAELRDVPVSIFLISLISVGLPCQMLASSLNPCPSSDSSFDFFQFFPDSLYNI